MGDKETEFSFLRKGTIMNETTFDKNLNLSGNSTRFGVNLVETKHFGKLNVKQILNTDEKFENPKYQTRFTVISPDVKYNNAKLCLENWTTVNYDKNFKKTDITNSIRPKLKLNINNIPIIGNTQTYSALKFDCSQSHPDIKFKGCVTGIQMTKKNLSTWIEMHSPAETSNFVKKASFVVGVGINLWK